MLSDFYELFTLAAKISKNLDQNSVTFAAATIAKILIIIPVIAFWHGQSLIVGRGNVNVAGDLRLKVHMK